MLWIPPFQWIMSQPSSMFVAREIKQKLWHIFVRFFLGHPLRIVESKRQLKKWLARSYSSLFNDLFKVYMTCSQFVQNLCVSPSQLVHNFFTAFSWFVQDFFSFLVQYSFRIGSGLFHGLLLTCSGLFMACSGLVLKFFKSSLFV